MRVITASCCRMDRAERERLAALFRSLAGRVPPRGAVVEINCVGRRRMARLNRAHRGRRGPTDILTFHYGSPPAGAGEAPVGEIYLCWDRLPEEAARRGVSRRAYAARLVAHGLFHLRGYRHDTNSAEARMERAERRLLLGAFSRLVVERLFA